MAEDLTQTILESLDKEDPNVLRAACFLSGEMELAQAERGLLKALGHKAWQVQAEAATALGRIKSKGALPYLRRVLQASEHDLRQKVLAAAAAATTFSGDDQEKTHPAVLKACALAINRISPNVCQEVLLEALKSDNPNLAGAAMVGLVNLEAEQGRDRMAEFLKSDEPGLRRGAAACLGKLHDKSALAGLLGLLEDDDPSVRKEALIALNNIKDKRTLPHVAARMEDSDPEVRRVTAIALGNTRQKDADIVDSLVKGLKDREPKVRIACLNAIANLKAHIAIEPCAKLISDTHEEVIRQAAITINVLSVARNTPDYNDS